MSSLRVFYSQSTNPWFNLAIEDALFRTMPTDQKVLFLWRNDNTVVIGRAQNPWKECNTAKMTQDGITLARRQSGGGAVFHDLGNTNFTFMASKPDYNKTVSTEIILSALKGLNVNAKATGRNDLVVVDSEGQERKFSGSAYKETQDRGFHHGTLLINANLSRLADYLNPAPKKLQAKGIQSVRSRVTNLTEIDTTLNHERLCQAITQAFFDHYQDTAQIEYISDTALPDLPELESIFAKQSSWAWNFGQSPEFTHQLDERFAWGGIDWCLTVKKGVIEQSRLFTDSLQPEPLEWLAKEAINAPYSAESLAQLLELAENRYPQLTDEWQDLRQWLMSAIA